MRYAREMRGEQQLRAIVFWTQPSNNGRFWYSPTIGSFTKASQKKSSQNKRKQCIVCTTPAHRNKRKDIRKKQRQHTPAKTDELCVRICWHDGATVIYKVVSSKSFLLKDELCASFDAIQFRWSRATFASCSGIEEHNRIKRFRNDVKHNFIPDPFCTIKRASFSWKYCFRFYRSSSLEHIVRSELMLSFFHIIDFWMV